MSYVKFNLFSATSIGRQAPLTGGLKCLFHADTQETVGIKRPAIHLAFGSWSSTGLSTFPSLQLSTLAIFINFS